MAESLKKINYLTEEQYQTAKENKELNENELYMTPDENYERNIDSAVSTNLFNWERVAPGVYMVSSNGQLNLSSSYVFCGYIPVKPKTTYTRSDVGTTTNAFFSETKGLITSSDGTTFTTPEDCKYVGFNMTIAKYNDGSYKTFMLNEGTTLLPYQAYVEPTLKLTDEKGNVHEFPLENNLTPDNFFGGSIVDFQTYLKTDAVPNWTSKLFNLSLNGAGSMAVVQKASSVYQSFLWISYGSPGIVHYKCLNGTWSSTNLH